MINTLENDIKIDISFSFRSICFRNVLNYFAVAFYLKYNNLKRQNDFSNVNHCIYRNINTLQNDIISFYVFTIPALENCINILSGALFH